ncbi:MAG: glycosyltransferase [Ignavibacteria bacterium]|jgi:glycosyltransferase involved in cell wall biosynthesis|nr:glycosyltransferase [Ignavibacteria bacterium]MCU7519299.1 glycosyltransferase [Ignavibacteria bacterium]
MDNGSYLVSAIVSTYNSEKFIRGKIEDLLEQTLQDRLEIIIVNSGSKQNEHSIISEYLDKHKNIKYINTSERESIYKAWNRGIKASTGKFIANSNTDDRLRNDAYEVLANVLADNPSVALVYADQYITNVPNQKFKDVQSKEINVAPEFNRIHQFERCIVGSQPMWRASLHFDDGIWFNEKYEVCGDHEFELNISQKYELLHHNEILGTFYKCPEKKNKEYENPKRTMDEVYEITLNYMKKYIRTLDNSELDKLISYVKKWIESPVYFSGIFRKILYRVKSNYMPSLEFIYILAALLATEHSGDLNRAKSYCEKFLRVRKSPRILHLYSSLQITKSPVIK